MTVDTRAERHDDNVAMFKQLRPAGADSAKAETRFLYSVYIAVIGQLMLLQGKILKIQCKMCPK